MKKKIFICLLFILLVGCKPAIEKDKSLVDCENTYSELNKLHNYLNDYLVLFSNGDYYVFHNSKSVKVDKTTIKEVSNEYSGKTIKIKKANELSLNYLKVLDHNTEKALVYTHYVNVFDINVYFFISGSIDNPISIYSDKFEAKQLNCKPTDGYINYIPYFDNISQMFYRPEDTKIKNIIFMVPDGGGYDNLTLASEVKEEVFKRGLDSLNGARTKLTNNMLTEYGYNPKGLYLDEFHVGSANTLLYTPHGDSYITDSSAAGTALSSGYKTSYCYSGIDSDTIPHASISELARLNGMSTGIVTTKSYVDATPLAFLTSHSIFRYEYYDNSLQALLSGADVVIAEGTEYGDILTADSTSNHPNISARSVGYDVATNKQELFALLEKKSKKIFAPILGVSHSNSHIQKESAYGVASDHIAYDIQNSDTNPTLLEMSQVAIETLSENINNPNGFFLMIEGGALDNAAEGGNLRDAVGEALAFDETFAYVVKWAKENGDETIVVACPDHDSGGFANIETCKDDVIDTIITGVNNQGVEIGVNYNYKKYNDSITLHGGHTDMPVPIFMYAPNGIKEKLLSSIGLPVETKLEDIRYKGTEYGNYYVKNTSLQSEKHTINPVINAEYLIQNSDIVHGIVKAANMGSLEAADSVLFVKVASTDEEGKQIVNDTNLGNISFGNTYETNGYKSYYTEVIFEKGNTIIYRDSNTYVKDNMTLDNISYETMKTPAIFVLTSYGKNKKQGSFYVPAKFISDNSLGKTITFIRGPEEVEGIMNMITILNGKNSFIVPENKFIYDNYKFIGFSDGQKIYKPGDVYTFSNNNNIVLTCVWE